MKTLPEHREIVVRLMEGGIYTDENILDNDYVDSVIHDARAYALRMDFNKTKRWSSSAIQIYLPNYEVDQQESICYTLFNLPTPFIQGNSAQDGLVYFGSSGNLLGTRNFRRIKTRNELADLLNHPNMSPANGRYVGVLFEGDRVTMVSDIAIKYPMITGVFDNPTLLPNYSIEKDMYPMSGDIADVVYDVVKKGTMYQVFSRPADTISNSKDVPQAQPIPKK